MEAGLHKPTGTLYICGLKSFRISVCWSDGGKISIHDLSQEELHELRKALGYDAELEDAAYEGGYHDGLADAGIIEEQCEVHILKKPADRDKYERC